jgi:hypothetical protein
MSNQNTGRQQVPNRTYQPYVNTVHLQQQQTDQKDTQEALGRGWKKGNIVHSQFKASEGGNLYAQVEEFRGNELLIRMEEAKRWVEDMLDEKIFVDDDSNGLDFLDQLRDGIALARLADAFNDNPSNTLRRKHINAKKGNFKVSWTTYML